MKGHGKKCKKCKEFLHYEQIHGMRLLFEDKNGKEFYNTYCPKCDEYDTELKKD